MTARQPSKSIVIKFKTTIDTGETRMAFYHLKTMIKEFSNVTLYSSSIFASNKFNFKYNNWKSVKELINNENNIRITST